MTDRPDIPMAEVRRMLRDLRRETNEKLDLIEARLHRRSPTRRAKVTSARMTPALADRIRQMAVENREMPMHEIAAALKVNVGRVSEVLAAEPATDLREADQPALLDGAPQTKGDTDG